MNPVETRPPLLARHPWLLVLFAFLLLLGAWSTLITIAVKHAPQRIPISSTQ
jgi:hypothetical protein